MKLNEIRDNKGARKSLMRVSRGYGSGKGRTGGRGIKGQKSRTGVSINAFEGGQMPSYRQMPKLKGFSLVNQIPCAAVNVRDFERWNLTEVDLDTLIKAGRVHPTSQKLRVLGNGEISKAVNVKADYYTPSAKEKIEKAGGKAELV